MRFRRNENEDERFQKAVEIVKDMNPEEFDRFIFALELAWQAYDAMRGNDPIDEIDRIEKEIEGA